MPALDGTPDWWALAMTVGAIAALLVLVLRVRFPAFLALILVSLVFGVASGMPQSEVIDAVRTGVGGTLGFVAVVVGLGAMMGALLESSGGVSTIADTLLGKFGQKRAPTALAVIGFLVSIPVFFDVALIILLPVILGLSRRTGKAVIGFAIPLLAGLAVTHAFVPPTPGPIAVAEILGADLGWVALFGVAAGLPAAIVGGPVLARYLTPQQGFKEASEALLARVLAAPREGPQVGFGDAMLVILLPVVLIIGATVTRASIDEGDGGTLVQAALFLGHPFSALLLACLVAWWRLGVRQGLEPAVLRDAMARALEPAGLVVLVTGAGGAFKQVLIASGAGAALAEQLLGASVPLLLFGFLTAGIVRIAQGSATVAMITAAGLCAPVAEAVSPNAPDLALLVIAIASGASLTSHVNDSGFWLVSRYLGLSEALTLRSWTVCTTLIGVTGFAVTAALSLLIGV